MLASLAAAAWAWDPPNSTIGFTAGTPWTYGGTGEAWFADELSGELGAGTGGDPVGFELALRWRPDALCFACGSRALVSVGVGAASTVRPDFALADPWRWAVGPDIAATFVYWFSPGYGLALSAHGGAGPAFAGTELADPQVAPWAFGTLGLAF